MNNSTTCRKSIHVLLFIVFGGIILRYLTTLVTAKEFTQEYVNCNALYSEAANSLDVVYLGSSKAYTAINPMIIYENHGITGYVYGTGAQRSWLSEYYLREILKKQQPKCVVYEVGELYIEDELSEARNAASLDWCRFSKEKIDAIHEAITDSDGARKYDAIAYFFPVIRYKERWAELTQRDFAYAIRGFLTDPFYQGYDFVTEIFKGENDYALEKTSTVEESIPKKSKAALDRIVSLCQNEGTELVLIKTSTLSNDWTIGRHNVVKKYADENKIHFIDYSSDRRLDIDISDRWDKVHLNYRGAEKFSALLGDDLTDIIHFEENNINTQMKDKYGELRKKYDEQRLNAEFFWQLKEKTDLGDTIINNAECPDKHTQDLFSNNSVVSEVFRAQSSIIERIGFMPVTWGNTYSDELYLIVDIKDLYSKDLIYHAEIPMNDIKEDWVILSCNELRVKKGTNYSIEFRVSQKDDYREKFSLYITNDFKNENGRGYLNGTTQDWSLMIDVQYK